MKVLKALVVSGGMILQSRCHRALSSAAIALAIVATTICAKAECANGVLGLITGCSPPVDDVPKRKQPQQSNETALHSVPALNQAAKRQKPQQGEEKAPPVSPPPALPRAVIQKSPVDGLGAGGP